MERCKLSGTPGTAGGIAYKKTTLLCKEGCLSVRIEKDAYYI